MNYYPKHKTCDELLILNGFTPEKTKGWEKILPNSPTGNRLHAFTHHGFIQIHYDVMGGPNGHQGKSYHKQAQKCIEEIETLDTSKWTLSNIINSLLYGKEK